MATSPAGAAADGAQDETRCATIAQVDRNLRICVKTGPGIPTHVWVDNKSGVTYFGVQLRVVQHNGPIVRVGSPFTLHAHSIGGMEQLGLPNGCYFGQVTLGGTPWYGTAEPACV
ncbi:hypothetical protein [Streptomyces ambofaciens]|uniref:hypothetical protein n=1 Tax=Streptomyces ambofaciens TaxID=1889 RepID=UPI0013148A75|nr:hypothetical protein [Streptomyces ambofaciens]